MNKNISALLKQICVVVLVALTRSCNNNHSTQRSRTTDSTEISNLLRNVYKWHDANKSTTYDFHIIVKDSFQVGVDTAQLSLAVRNMKALGFFSEGFLKNYEQIGLTVDHKLKHDTVKYYDEVNFGFQEADPWTYFQDDADNYSDSLIIHNLIINADTATLEWTIRGTDPYLIKLKHEGNSWKVAYMAGFDLEHP